MKTMIDGQLELLLSIFIVMIIYTIEIREEDDDDDDDDDADDDDDKFYKFQSSFVSSISS